MTTFYPFAPQPNAAFTFEPQLDGQSYNAIVSWSLFERRWYLNLYSSDGSLVVAKALIGSPTGFNIQALSWSHGRVMVTTELAHSYSFLDTVDLTFVGSIPNEFNGVRRCLITGVNTFEYVMNDKPGEVVQLGQVSYDVNLVSGYFAQSLLIFREASQNFETIP